MLAKTKGAEPPSADPRWQLGQWRRCRARCVEPEQPALELEREHRLPRGLRPELQPFAQACELRLTGGRYKLKPGSAPPLTGKDEPAGAASRRKAQSGPSFSWER